MIFITVNSRLEYVALPLHLRTLTKIVICKQLQKFTQPKINIFPKTVSAPESTSTERTRFTNDPSQQIFEGNSGWMALYKSINPLLIITLQYADTSIITTLQYKDIDTAFCTIFPSLTCWCVLSLNLTNYHKKPLPSTQSTESTFQCISTMRWCHIGIYLSSCSISHTRQMNHFSYSNLKMWQLTGEEPVTWLEWHFW